MGKVGHLVDNDKFLSLIFASLFKYLHIMHTYYAHILCTHYAHILCTRIMHTYYARIMHTYYAHMICNNFVLLHTI